MPIRPILRASVLATALAAGSPAFASTYFVVVPLPARAAAEAANISVTLSAFSPPAGIVGVAYPGFDFNSLLQVSGDANFVASNVRWYVAGGALPAGLSLSSSGKLTGTPSAAGTASFVVEATYRTKTGVNTYRISVSDLLVSLASATLPDATQGTAYRFDLNTQLTVSGDSSYAGSGVSWSLASGNLPAGLSLGADGVVSGTATAEGTYPFTVKATYRTKSGAQTYQVVVGAITVGLQQATPPQGIVGISYNKGTGFDLKPALTVSGDGAYAGNGTGVQWSLDSGALPSGLTLDASGGVISGTPDLNATTTTVQVRAVYKGKSATQSYTVPVVGSIEQFSGYRAYADGSYAATCNGYRNPSAPHYYQGATGDGVYRISPGGTPYDVFCDMTTNGGGYTVIEALHDTRYYTGATFVEAPAGSPPVPGEANGSYLTSSIAIALANLSTEVRISEFGTGNAAWSTNATVMNNLRQGLLANYNTLSAYDPTSQWSVSSPALTQFNSTMVISGSPVYYPTIYWAGGNSNGLHITGGGGAANASWQYSIQNGPMVVSYR